MSRMKTYENIVREVLKEYPETRGNDRRLYLELLKTIGCDIHITVEEFFSGEEYPNLESIRRVRQKIQEKTPELRPPEDVRNARKAKEQDVLEYVHE